MNTFLYNQYQSYHLYIFWFWTENRYRRIQSKCQNRTTRTSWHTAAHCKSDFPGFFPDNLSRPVQICIPARGIVLRLHIQPSRNQIWTTRTKLHMAWYCIPRFPRRPRDSRYRSYRNCTPDSGIFRRLRNPRNMVRNRTSRTSADKDFHCMIGWRHLLRRNLRPPGRFCIGEIVLEVFFRFKNN